MRIGTSDLDLYRSYLDEDSEMGLPELLAKLRREAPRPRYLDAGVAFHKLLEHAGTEEVSARSVDGFNFRFDLDATIALPQVRELKGELVVMTSVGPATLVGKVDGYDGGVTDTKLVGRFDAEKYFWSYQWRCYLLMFGAWRFRYDIFVQDEDKKTGEIVVKEYHPLDMYAYPEMERDVLRAVDGFAQFIAKHMPEKLESSADWQSEPRLMARMTKIAA
jgi:hypothetical protein